MYLGAQYIIIIIIIVIHTIDAYILNVIGFAFTHIQSELMFCVPIENGMCEIICDTQTKQ